MCVCAAFVAATCCPVLLHLTWFLLGFYYNFAFLLRSVCFFFFFFLEIKRKNTCGFEHSNSSVEDKRAGVAELMMKNHEMENSQ